MLRVVAGSCRNTVTACSQTTSEKVFDGFQEKTGAGDRGMEKEGGVIFKQGVSGVDRFSLQNGTKWFDTGTTDELFQLIRTSFTLFPSVLQRLFSVD